MALSAVDIASRALNRLGAASINGFDDGSSEAALTGSLYGTARDALLSAHPWSFATAQTSLGLLVEEPSADFAHAFQLPADFLRALSAGQGGRGRGLRYRITGQQLHSDAEELTLTYIFRADEAAIPPFFDQALIARLAAELCIPITESSSRADLMFRLAEDEFRRAKSIDAQQDTPQRFEDFSLIEARR
ncbi:MAG: hypothetical protein KI792_09860 [Alphaproteobacteria bacterium]|nr:hypothetical protein [Alphaproteobacteria bacterium SS10]